MALITVGLVLLWGSSLMPTIKAIIQDSVQAVGLLVAYYYGLAGLVAAYEFAGLRRESFLRWLALCVFPALSGLSLIVLGIYALTTFDRTTNIGRWRSRWRQSRAGRYGAGPHFPNFPIEKQNFPM